MSCRVQTSPRSKMIGLVIIKFLVQKKFLVQIICGRQNIWGDKKILVENVEGPRVPII